MASPPVDLAPALPWAVGAQPSQPQPAGSREQPLASEQDAGAADAPCTLQQVGLSVDDRIEVKWQVGEEGTMQYSRWWGAKVLGPSADWSEDNKLYDIEYDEYEDFEQEVVQVLFLGEHWLLDAGQGEEMLWRMEGEEFEEEAFEEATDASGAVGSLAATAARGGGGATGSSAHYTEDSFGDRVPRVVTLNQVVEALDDGDSAADTGMAALLGSLDPSKQRRVAEGFRHLQDSLAAFVAQMAAQKGPDGVIDTRDVKEFAARLRNGGGGPQ